MAKEHTEKAKKSKTAAQLAKKEENERLAAERLAKLQEQQKKCQELRKQGYVGSDFQILEKVKEDEIAAAKEKEEAQHRLFLQKKAAEERKYVEEAIDGPSGTILKKWLIGPATYKAVVKFFKSHNLPRVATEVKEPEPVQLNLPKLDIPLELPVEN